jgi:hypothetical protein
MCNSLRKWNAQFNYRLQTIQSLRLQRLWIKTLYDNPLLTPYTIFNVIQWLSHEKYI